RWWMVIPVLYGFMLISNIIQPTMQETDPPSYVREVITSAMTYGSIYAGMCALGAWIAALIQFTFRRDKNE
ncbi:MAG: hypothetical protein ACRC5C_12915, partial [Bacilli bacterium]